MALAFIADIQYVNTPIVVLYIDIGKINTPSFRHMDKVRKIR